jgi:hypothetical protein
MSFNDILIRLLDEKEGKTKQGTNAAIVEVHTNR